MESRMTVDGYGSEVWYNERGQLHRVDGPAVIWANGSKIWYQNGLLHRADGPARIWPDGRFEWRLNDKELSFTEWADELNLDSTQRLMMVLKWNPE